MPTGYVKAARMGELAPGQKKLVQIGGDRILLANLEGNYYAVDDVCPHAYGVLSMGQMAGDEVICPPPLQRLQRQDGRGPVSSLRRGTYRVWGQARRRRYPRWPAGRLRALRVSTEDKTMPDDFVKVAQTGELSPGQMKYIKLGRERICWLTLTGNITRSATYAPAPTLHCLLAS